LALNIQDNHKQLFACKKAIESQITDMGYFQIEKKTYLPHITLFRHLEKTTDFNQYTSTMTLKIHEISLLASRQGNNSVYYDTIATWPLNRRSIKQQLIGI